MALCLYRYRETINWVSSNMNYFHFNNIIPGDLQERLSECMSPILVWADYIQHVSKESKILSGDDSYGRMRGCIKGTGATQPLTSSEKDNIRELCNIVCDHSNLNLVKITRERLLRTDRVDNLSEVKDDTLKHRDLPTASSSHWVLVYFVHTLDEHKPFQLFDEGTSIDFPASKGDVVFFNGRTLHSNGYSIKEHRYTINVNLVVSDKATHWV